MTVSLISHYYTHPLAAVHFKDDRLRVGGMHHIGFLIALERRINHGQSIWLPSTSLTFK